MIVAPQPNQENVSSKVSVALDAMAHGHHVKQATDFQETAATLQQAPPGALQPGQVTSNVFAAVDKFKHQDRPRHIRLMVYMNQFTKQRYLAAELFIAGPRPSSFRDDPSRKTFAFVRFFVTWLLIFTPLFVGFGVLTSQASLQQWKYFRPVSPAMPALWKQTACTISESYVDYSWFYGHAARLRSHLIVTYNVSLPASTGSAASAGTVVGDAYRYKSGAVGYGWTDPHFMTFQQTIKTSGAPFLSCAFDASKSVAADGSISAIMAASQFGFLPAAAAQPGRRALAAGRTDASASVDSRELSGPAPGPRRRLTRVSTRGHSSTSTVWYSNCGEALACAAYNYQLFQSQRANGLANGTWTVPCWYPVDPGFPMGAPAVTSLDAGPQQYDCGKNCQAVWGLWITDMVLIGIGLLATFAACIVVPGDKAVQQQQQ